MINDYLINCNYNLNNYKEKIYIVEKSKCNFNLDNNIITNMTFTTSLLFCYEVEDINFETSNEFDGNKYFFNSKLSFSINPDFNYYTIIDVFNKDNYIIIEDKNEICYLINLTNKYQLTHSLSLTKEEYDINIELNFTENTPVLQIDNMNKNQFNTFKLCSYTIGGVDEVYAINDKNIIINYDWTLNAISDIVIDDKTNLKTIDIYNDSFSLTSNFENNNYVNEIKFNLPLSYNYNWHSELISNLQEKYTFIIRSKSNKCIIIQNNFPSFDINDFLSITMNSISSMKNVYFIDYDKFLTLIN